MFALVDANNFFVSCERIFRPDLKNKPVVVLSNNDGCIIARSQEVKDLNIPMGAPYFKYRKICEENNVAMFSSNFQLYGDLSNRFMHSLKLLSPKLEVYSIDEAFLDLTKIADSDLIGFGEKLQTVIKSWLSLPISVGIGSTKTLAKIANYIAKKQKKVIFLKNDTQTDNILETMPVNEVWGIGKNITISLARLGITSAKQLKYIDPKLMRKRFGVVGERIVLELNGIICLEFKELQKPKKNIISSRSFGKPVTNIKDLEEAISNYVARGCEKLRQQNSKAYGIEVFIRTNKFKSQDKYYYNSKSYYFSNPTSNTCELIIQAKKLLQNIYRIGYSYNKAGIYLLDLVNNGNLQSNLLETSKHIKSDKLMNSLDKINASYGANTIFIASQGIERDWQMRSDHRSMRYTTKWDELPTVT